MFKLGIIDMSNLAYISGFSRQVLAGNLSIEEDVLSRIDNLNNYHLETLYFAFDSKILYKQIMFKQFYKATRHDKESAEEKGYRDKIYAALRNLRLKVLPYKGWKDFVLIQTGYEADDIIAEFVTQNPKSVIVSSDTDYYQLLDRAAFILNPMTFVQTDKRRLLLSKGLRPEEWPMYRSLVGKTGEIDGVYGVGPKTAMKILGGQKIPDKVQAEMDKSQGKIKRNLKMTEMPFQCNIPLKLNLKGQNESP